MEHPVGERNLLVSTCKSELQGFNLNKNYKLNALLAVTPVLELNTETMYASAVLPAFNSAEDVLNVRKLPYFRIVFSLGTLTDIHFVPNVRSNHYVEMSELNGVSMEIATEWLSTNDRFDEQKLELQFDECFVDLERDNITYMLSMGIQFGNVAFGGKLNP